MDDVTSLLEELMELVLTEDEHDVLPESRQTGVQQEDGTYRISLDSDPWVQIDAANRERDAVRKERDAFKRENDKFREQARDNGITLTTVQRSLKEYTVLGTPEEFGAAKQRLAAMPPDEDPKMAEMQAQLDAMKKDRDEDIKAREAAEAARVMDHRRGKLREIVSKAGVRPEFIGMYVNDLVRRGLSESVDRLYVGPEGNRLAADDVIRSELEGSFKILVAGSAPARDGKNNVTPLAVDLAPDEVTLSGDPAARRAALAKLSNEMFPNVAERAVGMRTP